MIGLEHVDARRNHDCDARNGKTVRTVTKHDETPKHRPEHRRIFKGRNEGRIRQAVGENEERDQQGG